MEDTPSDRSNQAEHADGHPGERGRLMAAAADRIVRLHKHFYGKGPTKAKAYLQGDLLVVLLKGGFTRVEHTLLGSGHREAVVAQRLAYQDAVRHDFVGAMEDLLGREVLAFMSANSQDPEMMAELFVLAPQQEAAEDLARPG